jgi:hypothetical protein
LGWAAKAATSRPIARIPGSHAQILNKNSRFLQVVQEQSEQRGYARP